MSSHTVNCSNCGQQVVIECDKRQLGGGRKHDLDWRPGPNHEKVRHALHILVGWQTVKAVRAWLNNAVDRGIEEAGFGDFKHVGKSIYWTQLAVEDPMSDLRGTDVVESMLPAKGREWLYRIREGAA